MWVYDGQKHFRLLTADTKISPEQARAFGELYGKCIKCDSPLTDEESISRGYGPICARKMGF